MKLSALTPDAKNANKGTARGRKLVRESLKRYGAGRSILLDKSGNIIAGNKTAEAAQAVGLGDVQIVKSDGTKLVAVQRTDLDINDRAARELAIADNRASELGLDWDLGVLKEFKIEDVDLSPFWDSTELAGLLGEPLPEAPEPKLDQAAELQKKWRTKRGDLWEIGKHRLLCGDCTVEADVQRLMRGEVSVLCFTSPPYSDQREYGGSSMAISDLARIFESCPARFFVVNLGLKFREEQVDDYWQEWITAARQVGLKLLAWNVWDKVNATSVRAQSHMFALQHEWIFVFGKERGVLNRTWDKSPESQKREAYYSVNVRGQKVTTRRQTDGSVKETPIGEIFDHKQLGSVFTAHAEMSREITCHPAMFPVTLPTSYIEAMTNTGDCVIEPFLGSGTTMVAAEQLNRTCYSCEIEPKYVAVALERMHDMGLTPKLADA